MKRQAFKPILGIFSTMLLIATIVTLVEFSNGAFSSNYPITGVFTSAGTGLHVGSEVTLRGVQIGNVSGIALKNNKALITLLISPNVKLPSNTLATITPQNVFGAEEVSMTFTAPAKSPYIKPGGVISHTKVSQQFEQLFEAAAPLLKQINPTYLSNVITGLNQSTAGESGRISLGFNEEAKFAQLLSSTLDNQLAALDSFTRLSQVLAGDGSYFNSMSSASNQFMPAFNQASNSYAELINNFGAFSENLAQFLSQYHPDIVNLITSGDNVSRLFLAHETDLENLLHGLYRYVYKIAISSGPAAETLPNGSTFGYFKTFILFSDVNTLVCNLIAPSSPGLSQLVPLQQAIDSPSSPFNCTSEIAKFNQAQLLPSSSPPPSTASPQVNSAANQVLNQAMSMLGSPQSSKSSGLNSYLQMLIGQTP